MRVPLVLPHTAVITLKLVIFLLFSIVLAKRDTFYSERDAIADSCCLLFCVLHDKIERRLGFIPLHSVSLC